MVQAGIGGLDTPRTNLGDATFLSNQQLDFDISQEQSFQSPSKDNNNLMQQLKTGRRGAINLKTPRSRGALRDRRNLPVGLGGGEFTPLLKSATRNSALRNGKENVLTTPGFLRSGGLGDIPEDFSPLPVMGSSIYGQDSRNGSYIAGTPIPQIDSSSTASTPMALLPRRNDGPGVLQDGNQLSLREQENVIDKIEKENFGLKLKIHFLEEALRKAGPGFSEAALKENTDLKVDQVTLQKELHRYRKTLASAERDVEHYRQQILEMQEKVRRKHADESQQEELNSLRMALEEKEAELDRLRRQECQFDGLQDKIHELEADLREKGRIINDSEDEVDNLKDEIEKQASKISDLQEAIHDTQRRSIELEEKAQASEDLAEAKETIDELERELERLKNDAQDVKEDRQEAFRERDRAQADLEELQDEMANKSITTKGLSRQIEEKSNRLQDELEDLRERHSVLTEQHDNKVRDIKKLEDKVKDLKQDSDVREQKLKDKLEIVQNEKEGAIRDRISLATKFETLQSELQQKTDEKDLLQIRHDALTSESASLQRDISKSSRSVEELEEKLKHEQASALASEREIKDEYKGELNRLLTVNDRLTENIEQLKEKMEDLEAEIRHKERLYDDDSDKWDNERRNLEAERDRAEEKATGLQGTIDKLQEAEGTLSGQEMKLQQAIQSEKDRYTREEAALTCQINELIEDLDTRQKALDEERSELASVREELRLSKREQKSLAEKIEGLEDEVDILQTNLDEETEQANQELSSAKQESESLRRQLQTLKQDLVKLESFSADAQAEIESFKGDLQAGQGSKEQLASRLRDVEAQLAKVRQDKQSLQDQIAVVNVEVHSLRASKADLQAERDEIQSQLRAMKQQEEETFRLDQERMDLRTAKMKLDSEVRRLREENKTAVAQQETLETELQKEIDRASAEEIRLNTELHDLQKILRGSSEKRELSVAKKMIQHLEERIQDLEIQLTSANGNADHTETTNELSVVRKDLAAARQKETEYLHREAAQRDVLRGLKRQITELERKAHDAEISRLAISSPHSSTSGSARKSEVIEVRHQLAAAHQTLKELRTQLKDAEREATGKVKAAAIELRTQTEAWEIEKDQLERSLDEALLERDELASKNSTSESAIIRLRNKIERLENALQTERQNSGEDRTMALERRDLHEMLRETQLQAESLELVVKDRESTIAAITATESDLRAHLKRTRDDRASHRSRAMAAQVQLEDLERKFRKSRDAWEVERKALSKGVRFPNMSLSVNDESEILALRMEAEERENKHVKELRGLCMQIEWLRARFRREEGFRAAASYAKRYMGLQIELFEACNKADLALLRSAPVALPERPKTAKKTTFRQVAIMIRATVRMKKGAEQWAKSRKIHDSLVAKVESMKRKVSRKSIGNGR